MSFWKGGSGGFSLLETVIAMLILLVAVTALASVILWGAGVMSEQGWKGDAALRAQQEIEREIAEQ